jgi:hypothetical protein
MIFNNLFADCTLFARACAECFLVYSDLQESEDSNVRDITFPHTYVSPLEAAPCVAAENNGDVALAGTVFQPPNVAARRVNMWKTHGFIAEEDHAGGALDLAQEREFTLTNMTEEGITLVPLSDLDVVVRSVLVTTREEEFHDTTTSADSIILADGDRSLSQQEEDSAFVYVPSDDKDAILRRVPCGPLIVIPPHASVKVYMPVGVHLYLLQYTVQLCCCYTPHSVPPPPCLFGLAACPPRPLH